MCGIAGRFSPIHLPPDPDWAGRADALLQHRGPDGRGHFRDEVCELVHRRLAIIDLSPTGLQPMPNEDGNVQVIFNGEIYNHRELRQDLEARGHRFRGTSDTEVLAHLYEEDGAELAGRLRGMFAFAIYDRRGGALLLGRDRYGIKPLYVAVLDDQVVFASEIKAILAVRGFERTIDRQACYDFLGLGYIPEPASGFVGLRMLPKGTTLLVDRLGEHSRCFATLRAEPRPDLGMEEAVTGVQAALVRAARDQSIADVPVAALLSGGIDSSLVVAGLCRSTGSAPNTFNVRFPDAAYDETDMATAVARRYGTNHHTIDLDERILAPDSVAGLLRHFDQPFADSSLIPTYAVCRAIRDRGIVCTISGDGGDEAFGGYASFWRLNILDRLAGLPAPVRVLLRRAGETLAPRTRDFGRQLAKAVRLASLTRTDTSGLFAAFYNYLSEDQKEDLVRRDARTGLAPARRCFGDPDPPGAADLETLSKRLTEAIFADSLPADMLRKVDMMSMRTGIEVRVPMLDEEVMGWGIRLPHRLKTNGRRGKLVLRRLAESWLPRSVARHRKQGFAIPLDRMVGQPFYDMLADLLLSEQAGIRSFMNVALVDCWIRWFREAGQGRQAGGLSRAGLYQRVFILMALEIWLREQRLTW